MFAKKVIIFYLALFEYFWSVLAGYEVAKNLTNFLKHRKKRSLVFNDGGSTKLVIGPIYPVELEDPINWRNLICFYNIQVGNYDIPSKPLYPWDEWENFYTRANGARSKNLQPDESREFLYLVLERFMALKHGNGRECLLRAICENVQTHEHMDLFAEILNVILTPGKADVDAIYAQAYEMGKAGVDCIQYYRKCPRGFSFLDHLLLDNSWQSVY